MSRVGSRSESWPDVMIVPRESTGTATTATTTCGGDCLTAVGPTWNGRWIADLALAAAHPETVLDRDMLWRACWGGSKYPNSRTLDQHIAKLRKKIGDDAKDPTIVQTVRGVGYRYSSV